MKNILTRVMALICLAAWVFGRIIGVAAYELGWMDIYRVAYFIIPAAVIIVGFFQIIISIIRWKKLITLDKVLSLIVLVGNFFIFIFLVGPYFLFDF